MKGKDKDKVKEIARKRVAQLFKLARQVWKKDVGKAKRYVSLARELSRKAQVKLTVEQKRSFCKVCNMPFMPGGCKVRIKSRMRIVRCKCGAVRRFKV